MGPEDIVGCLQHPGAIGYPLAVIYTRNRIQLTQKRYRICEGITVVHRGLAGHHQSQRAHKSRRFGAYLPPEPHHHANGNYYDHDTECYRHQTYGGAHRPHPVVSRLLPRPAADLAAYEPENIHRFNGQFRGDPPSGRLYPVHTPWWYVL